MPPDPKDKVCAVFWGSHGCDLPKGHSGPHRCLDREEGRPDVLCSELDEANPGQWAWWDGDDSTRGARPL